MIALLLILAAAPAGGAAQLLTAIEEAHDDYRLRDFYTSSREFLAKYPRHPRAERVRYDLALQMISETITQPRSSTAAEARRLLEHQVATSKSEDHRFDAALLLMKFAPEEERLPRSEAMLRRFPKHRMLDQVYLWRIEQLLLAKDVKRAAADAEALLAKFPKTSDPDRYRRLIVRASLIGKPIPWTEKERAELKVPLEGKVLIVDFFATWCAPCVESVPHLRALAEKHPEVQVIGVSLDEDEQALTTYLKDAHLPWPVLRSGNEKHSLAARCGVGELPIYLLTDPQGRVTQTELRGDSLAEAL